MHYVTPPLEKIVDHYKIPKILHTEDIFHEVQKSKCTKSLYQTDTIRPLVHSLSLHGPVLLCSSVHCPALCQLNIGRTDSGGLEDPGEECRAPFSIRGEGGKELKLSHRTQTCHFNLNIGATQFKS